MSARASRVEWQWEQGLLVLYGEGHDARETEGVALPFATLNTLATYARRSMVRADLADGRPGWRSEPVVPTTCDAALLQTTGGERVCMVLDRGQDTELAFSLEPAAARALAQALERLAKRASGRPPARN